jgi:hypothetical protein
MRIAIARALSQDDITNETFVEKEAFYSSTLNELS